MTIYLITAEAYQSPLLLPSMMWWTHWRRWNSPFHPCWGAGAVFRCGRHCWPRWPSKVTFPSPQQELVRNGDQPALQMTSKQKRVAVLCWELCCKILFLSHCHVSATWGQCCFMSQDPEAAFSDGKKKTKTKLFTPGMTHCWVWFPPKRHFNSRQRGITLLKTLFDWFL